MKKILTFCLMAMLALMPCTLSAQSLGSILKGIFGGNQTQTTTETPAPETTGSNASTSDILSGVLGALGGTAENTTEDGGAASNGGVISGILNSVLNAFSTVSEDKLVGTWNYKGSAFVFESDNALANLGSDAVAKQVASKVDTYLAKIGVKPGACTMTFNEDGTCVFTVGQRGLNGTYTYEPSTKELALAFGVIKTKAFVVSDAGNINIVFQSNGLLKILKAVCSASSKSTLKMLNTLLQNYDGLRVGMAFYK